MEDHRITVNIEQKSRDTMFLSCEQKQFCENAWYIDGYRSICLNSTTGRQYKRTCCVWKVQLNSAVTIQDYILRHTCSAQLHLDSGVTRCSQLLKRYTCSAFRLKCQNANRTEWTQEPMVYKISPVSRWTCCRWTFSSAMPMLIRSNQQSTTSIIYYRKSVSRIPVECAGKKRSLKIPAEWNTSLLKYMLIIASNTFQQTSIHK